MNAHIGREARIIPGREWVLYYLDDDYVTLVHFLDSLNSLKPLYRKMKGITDPQRWLNEYSRIIQDGYGWKYADEPTDFADVSEVREYLTTVINEIEEATDE